MDPKQAVLVRLGSKLGKVKHLHKRVRWLRRSKFHDPTRKKDSARLQDPPVTGPRPSNQAARLISDKSFLIHCDSSSHGLECGCMSSRRTFQHHLVRVVRFTPSGDHMCVPSNNHSKLRRCWLMSSNALLRVQISTLLLVLERIMASYPRIDISQEERLLGHTTPQDLASDE